MFRCNCLWVMIPILSMLCVDGYAEDPISDTSVYQLERTFPATVSTSVDLSPDGTRLLTRHMRGDWDETYREYDVATGEILRECSVDSAPWSGRYSADGTHVWVTRYYGGHVSELNLETCEYDCDLSVGSWTVPAVFDDARRYLFVGENCPGAGALGSLKVVDTENCSVACTVPLNGEPQFIAKASGDPFVYAFTINRTPQSLYKIDPTTCTVAGQVDFMGIVGAPGFSIAPDASRAYIPDKAGGVLHVVDTDTMTIADSWPIPGDSGLSDWGFHVEPAGEFALLLSGHARVRIFSLEKQQVVQEIPLQGSVLIDHNRWQSVWNQDGRVAYVPVQGFDGDAGVVELVRRCVSDTDNDGMPDCDDKCPATEDSPTIVINGCETGVDNHLFDFGCSMLDLIEECSAGASNHGQFVRCVGALARDWRQAGLITSQERASIVRCVARNNIGNIPVDPKAVRNNPIGNSPK